MDKLLFNAICDMNTDTMDRYLTDEALIEFAIMVVGDLEAEVYYSELREFDGTLVRREITDREFLFIAIREWRKNGLLRPY